MAEEVPGQIAPHGGALVNRLLSEEASAEAAAKAKSLPRVSLKRRERCDLESLAVGVFSPLAGFMTQKEFDAVVGSMHLPTGEPWTIPVTLSVSKDEAAALKVGGAYRTGRLLSSGRGTSDRRSLGREDAQAAPAAARDWLEEGGLSQDRQAAGRQ